MLAHSPRVVSRFALLSAATLVVASLLPTPAARAQIPYSFPSLYAGNTPEDVELADTDGDGRLDLFVSNGFIGGVRVFLGQDGAHFETAFHLVVASARDFAVADLDADGRADVASVNDFDGLQVRLSLGGGAYAAPIALPISGSGRSVATGDLDGDGDLDLVVGLLGGDRASVALGAGDGSFTPAADIAVPDQHDSVRTGDIDGDGIDDLLSWRDAGSPVALELNLGSARFAAPVTVFTPSAFDLDVGDVDGDGTDDLVLVSSVSTHIVFGQLGGLPLPPQQQLFFLGSADVVRIADVDADGRADIALGDGSVVGVAVQLDGGGFPPFTGLAISGAGPNLVDLASGDLDHDGTADLVSLGSNQQPVMVHTGQGDGVFRPAYAKKTFAGLFRGVTADIDVDGRTDVLVNTSNAIQSVWPGRFDASLGKPFEFSVGLDDPLGYDVSDANGDGWPDVLAYTNGVFNSAAQVSITLGNGDFTFGLPATTQVASTGASGDFADFDGDGRTDILLVGQTQSGARLSRMANAGSSFVLDHTTVFAVPSIPSGVHVVDLDEDGTLDVVLEFTAAGLHWLKGFANGSYALPAALPGLPIVDRETLADLTGDGHLDVVGFVQGEDTLLVASGNGDTTFDAPVLTPVPPSAVVQRVDDYDGDGLLDVAVATTQFDPAGPDHFVRLYRNQGAGQLALAGSVTLEHLPRDVLFADTNGDGARDMIVVHDNQIVVLLNEDGPWDDLGHPLAGSAGFCELVGEGPLQPGAPLTVAIQHATPLAPVIFVVGTSAVYAPFKGGTLVPTPFLVIPAVPTDAQGALLVNGTWPLNVPSGASLVMQAWLIDAGGPVGFSATNALSGTTP